jgi:hypothetical protein
MTAMRGDLVATVITTRPETFQTASWASDREGRPTRALVRGTRHVTSELWRDTELLVVDVADLPLLLTVFGDRVGVTVVMTRGAAEQIEAAQLYAQGRISGFVRMDEFDPRSALLAILDRFRSGDREQLMAVLRRD